MNSHKRQSSSGSFNQDQMHLQTSFSSLENFMFVSKLMQDEIMVPSKLKDKVFDQEKAATTNSNPPEESTSTDALDHYRFILLIRNQFMQSNPFINLDEYKNKELKNKNFKKTFENLSFHFTELMAILDSLSNEARAITDIYKENV